MLGDDREVDPIVAFHDTSVLLDEIILSGDFLEGSRLKPVQSLVEQREANVAEPEKPFECASTDD